MDCPGVRELLPEHALGTLDADGRRLVERHVAWCAGCRKELRHLEEGGAGLALSTVAVEPPRELESRVLRAVAPGRREVRRSRPRAVALAAALAGALALGSVAWAVTLSGRLAELEGDAREALSAVEQFEGLLPVIGGEDVRAADLSGSGEVLGRALVYDGDEDWVLVMTTGLPERGAPYRAYLASSDGRLRVGRLAPQGPPGSGQLARIRLLPGGVSGFDAVLILDANDTPVLRGVLESSDG